MLCKDVIEQEIYDGLMSISDDKDPVVDGFNAYFFKKAWKIIHQEVITVVMDFFTTGKL